MNTIFATKLALKKLLGRRPHMPWKAIANVAIEPRRPPVNYSHHAEIAKNGDGSLVLLRFNGCDIWWPAEATRAYIGCEHAAVTDPRHPHFYEKRGTIVEPGDIVVDCGSCEGFFAHQVKDRARQIHLFEPVPILVECLRKTFSSELGEKIHVWELALGRTGSVAQLLVDRGDYQGSKILPGDEESQGISAQVVTLDDFILEQNIPRVDFIKIDAEGADLDVLAGGQMMLRKFLPKVAVATYHQAEHAVRIRELFKDISPAYRCAFSGTANCWTECRPLMAHFWVDKKERKVALQ